MKQGGTIEELIGNEVLAPVRLDNAHPGNLLLQLTGEFAHDALHVAARGADARRKQAHQSEIKRKSANGDQSEAMIEQKENRYDGEQRDDISPDIHQRAAYQ